MELTLAQLFGVSAAQDSQALIIKKSDLPLLTPSSNNTAESLLIALLIRALNNFSGNIQDHNSEDITDHNGEPISFDSTDSYTYLRVFLWNENLVKKFGYLFIKNTIVVEYYEIQ